MLSNLIAAWCVNMALIKPNENNACNSGLNQFMAQAGVTDTIESTRKIVEMKGKQIVNQYVAKQVQEKVAGIATTGYILIVKKEITFTTSRVPFVNDVQLRATPDSGTIKFVWRF